MQSITKLERNISEQEIQISLISYLIGRKTRLSTATGVKILNINFPVIAIYLGMMLLLNYVLSFAFLK